MEVVHSPQQIHQPEAQKERVADRKTD